jgi:hypothetical protein
MLLDGSQVCFAETRGVDKFFKTLAKLASSSEFLLAVMKQLAQNIEKVSERGKHPRQAGEWVCIFTRKV